MYETSLQTSKNLENEERQCIYTFAEGSEPVPCEMYIDMSIFSDENDFNPSELTRILQIEPTLMYHKGDLIRKNLYRKETCWQLNTPHIKTFDFEEIFQMLVNILDGKAELLRKYVIEKNDEGVMDFRVYDADFYIKKSLQMKTYCL